MRTYAEYLNTMTVKALNSIARMIVKADGTLLKGYSKLRKAELITLIDNTIAESVPVILDVEAPADHDTIAALIAEIAVETPVKAPESAVEAVFSSAPKATMPQPEIIVEDAPETVELEEVKFAYRAMRKTLNSMRNTPARIRTVGRLRSLSEQLKTMGIKNPALL